MGLLRLSGVIAAAAAFAIGCGDESSDSEQSDDPGAEFATAASDLCVQEAVEQREIIQANFPVNDAAASAAQIEELRESFNGLSDDFEGLEPPADLASTYDEFLASRETIDLAREELAAAQQSGDEEGVGTADAELQEAGDERAELAKELGLTACTREVPAEQEEAATALLEEISTSTDPARVCDELVYDEYLEGSFPGDDPAARCADFQQKLEDKDQSATGIEVVKVTGTDGVSASVEYSDVGGKFDGQPARATLYYEDGVWRLWEIVGL